MEKGGDKKKHSRFSFTGMKLVKIKPRKHQLSLNPHKKNDSFF